MSLVTGVVLPLVSATLGALITYRLKARTRQRTREEDVLHEAIAAVAVAAANREFIPQVAAAEQLRAAHVRLGRVTA